MMLTKAEMKRRRVFDPCVSQEALDRQEAICRAEGLICDSCGNVMVSYYMRGESRICVVCVDGDE